jgi:hypothetical protein
LNKRVWDVATAMMLGLAVVRAPLTANEGLHRRGPGHRHNDALPANQPPAADDDAVVAAATDDEAGPTPPQTMRS